MTYHNVELSAHATADELLTAGIPCSTGEAIVGRLTELDSQIPRLRTARRHIQSLVHTRDSDAETREAEIRHEYSHSSDHSSDDTTAITYDHDPCARIKTSTFYARFEMNFTSTQSKSDNNGCYTADTILVTV